MNSIAFFWSTVVGFDLLILFEYLYDKTKGRGLYEVRDAWANIAMYWGSVLVHILWAGPLYLLYAGVHQFALFKIEPDWQAWLLLLFLEDLCFYWFHRASHRVRLLWAAHVNHHSSRQFNLTVALRQTWTPFLGVLFWLPLPLLGFAPAMVLLMQAISLLYQSLMHTRLFGDFGPVGLLLNTPAHHRVHHGVNPEYIDKNYAGVFIIWDRFFGTFQAERAPVRYGITRDIDSQSPLRIAFHEYGAIVQDIRNSWKQGLISLVRPPGWVSRSERERAESSSRSVDPVDDAHAIVLLFACALFTLVFLSPHLFPVRNFAPVVYLLAVAALAFCLWRTGGARTFRLAAIFFLIVILIFPVVYTGFFERAPALEILAAVWNVFLCAKTVSILRGARVRNVSFTHVLYFLCFSPELNFYFFKAQASRPVRFTLRLWRGPLRIAAGGLLLVFLLGGGTAVHPDLYIPLTWIGAGWTDWRAWVPPVLKGLSLYLFARGGLLYATDFFNAFGFRLPPAPRSPLRAPDPLTFWRRFYAPAWRVPRAPVAVGGSREASVPAVFAFFFFAGIALEYFLMIAATSYRPGWAGLFFLTQGVLAALALVASRRFRRSRPSRPRLALGAVLNVTQLVVSSVLFFQAWDGLFV